jgi:lipopolysaccharide/colanic/teichoic acid biosynthesis glycosyltransferase
LRRLGLIAADVSLVTIATIWAIIIRGDYSDLQVKLITLTPYISFSAGCALVVFSVAGLDRLSWRYSSAADYLQLIILVTLTILLALVCVFILNRLEGVARSLPILQGGLIVSTLFSVRAAIRLWHIRRLKLSDLNENDQEFTSDHETILVVGLNTISELFLMSVRELAPQQVRVAGVLTDDPTLRGRKVYQTPILGSVDELYQILQSLEVHGVAINRIIVASTAKRLRPRALELLLKLEKSSNIVVQFLPERLGLESSPRGQNIAATANLTQSANKGGYATRKSFRIAKRTIDILGAVFLLFIFSPLAALVAVIVAFDVGFPVLFWQQRPGLHGRPFKMFKFRTMAAPHDQQLQRIPDDRRSSAIGKLLRRTRLDELPQIFNVLVGDMSLIGPRPLLPLDQAGAFAARLSVRPGITGWAQVNGGRTISPSDKFLLDIWYVQNASFSLDFKIVMRTLQIMLFGDQLDAKAILQARNFLGFGP